MTVAVGLKAVRITMGMPLEMPPWTPPDLLDWVKTFGFPSGPTSPVSLER
jgi:hypothetical protein